MKYLVPFCLAILVTVGAASSALAQNRTEAGKSEVLTNESIVNLTKAGFKDRTIIMLIRSSETRFDIGTPRLVELKKRGVHEQVITAMIERTNMGLAAQRMTTLRDDEFFAKDDDAFFNGPIFKQVPSEKEARRREEEAMIFGSQSGSKSEVRSRGTGPNASVSRQGEVSGSATVHIVRPPSESAAEPKLQRASKLDNQGVLEMIQAGFSEGTILRKIETSQVDFDLSQKAVTDLRQNRVSERIIRAMTVAMDESK